MTNSTSKTLAEIIEAVRDGQRPDYEDLRYAICAMEALGTFNRRTLMRLAEAEERDQRRILGASAQWQLQEHFRREQQAYTKPPKEWVGWNNDPENPECLERRALAKRVMAKFTGGQR